MSVQQILKRLAELALITDWGKSSNRLFTLTEKRMTLEGSWYVAL